MSDKALLLAILIVNDLAIAAMFIAFNASRFYDLRRECAEKIGQANAEAMAARKMVRRTEVQARVMDAMPVSRLIQDRVMDARVEAAIGEKPAKEMLGLRPLIGGER